MGSSAARLWALALLGVALEGCWIALAALTGPLTHSSAYLDAWTASLGPLAPAWTWLAQKLVALVPSMLASGFDHGAPFVSFLIGLAVASGGYLIAMHVAGGLAPSRTAMLLVTAFALLFQLTLWSMPGILTTDLASYVMDGRISAVYGADPFVVAPEAFPNDAVLPWIATSWWPVPTIYGPLWLDMSWLVARATAALPTISQVVTYRALANIGYLATLGVGYWLLCRLRPASRVASFTALAWSPLLLLQLAANGHNDSPGVLLLLVGFACLCWNLRGGISNWAWGAALTLFALAALVKFLSVFAIVFCAIGWWRFLPSTQARLRWLGGTAVVLAVITLLLDARWLPQPFLPGQSVARLGDFYAHSLTDMPAAWFAAHVLDRNGDSVVESRQIARTIFWIPAVGAFLVLFASDMRRVWRRAHPDAPRETVRAIVAATTRTLLAFIVLASTQVHIWYFTWPAAVGLLLGWRNMTARVAVAYGLLFTLVAYFREDTGQPPIDPLLIVYAVLPLALPAFSWARRRWRASEQLDDVRPAVEPDRVGV